MQHFLRDEKQDTESHGAIEDNGEHSIVAVFSACSSMYALKFPRELRSPDITDLPLALGLRRHGNRDVEFTGKVRRTAHPVPIIVKVVPRTK